MIARALLMIGFLLIGVPASLAAPSDSEEHLLARLQKETDPIKKSKDTTRLARLKLEQVIQAYEHGSIEQGAQLIPVYLGRIMDSWHILKGCGRNAAHDPKGFKELDIELREDVRLLEDLKRRVSYDDRAPLEQTGKEVEGVRAEVLHALFPITRVSEAPKPASKPE